MSESSLEIRNAFVRKVYTILCAFNSGYPLARDRMTWITNPPLLFSSRTDCKQVLSCVVQPSNGLTPIPIRSSPQLLSVVCSLNPHLRSSGFKPSTSPLYIASLYLDTEPTQPMVVLRSLVWRLHQSRPTLLETPQSPTQPHSPVHLYAPRVVYPRSLVCIFR